MATDLPTRIAGLVVDVNRLAEISAKLTSALVATSERVDSVDKNLDSVIEAITGLTRIAGNMDLITTALAGEVRELRGIAEHHGHVLDSLSEVTPIASRRARGGAA